MAFSFRLAVEALIVSQVDLYRRFELERESYCNYNNNDEPDSVSGLAVSANSVSYGSLGEHSKKPLDLNTWYQKTAAREADRQTDSAGQID